MQLDLFKIADVVPFPPAARKRDMEKLAIEIMQLDPRRQTWRVRHAVLEVRRRLYADRFPMETVEPLAGQYERALRVEIDRQRVKAYVLGEHAEG